MMVVQEKEPEREVWKGKQRAMSAKFEMRPVEICDRERGKRICRDLMFVFHVSISTTTLEDLSLSIKLQFTVE